VIGRSLVIFHFYLTWYYIIVIYIVELRYSSLYILCYRTRRYYTTTYYTTIILSDIVYLIACTFILLSILATYFLQVPTVFAVIAVLSNLITYASLLT